MLTLDQWLAGLDAAELEAVIERRPEVLHGTPPRDLRGLAARLEHVQSMFALLNRVPLPHLQVLEALTALGDHATEPALIALLAPTGPQHARNVAGILAELRQCAAVWPTGSGAIGVADGVSTLLPNPLGLSSPLRALLPTLNVDGLRRVLQRLGATTPTRRADLEDAVVAELSNPDRVRDLVAAAPPAFLEPLLVLAQDVADPYGEDGLRQQSHEQRQRQHMASVWASERGLLMGSPYGYGWSMPAEVALALRGPDYRAPFSPVRPEPASQPVDPAAVAAAGSAAVSDFSQQAVAVLDVVAAGRFAMAKAGGLAVRELARIAKLAMVDAAAARLTLELADALDLLVVDEETLSVTDEFRRWRENEPAARYASLLLAWWKLPFAATLQQDRDAGKTRPLSRQSRPPAGAPARHALHGVLSSIAAGQAAQLGSTLATVGWERPMVDVSEDGEPTPLLAAWHEAEALGVLARGALTEVGRALGQAEPAEVVRLATRALPASSDRAVFGSDLTVLVAGSPTAALSSLLDSAAERESRGAGITWRFSTLSVRRALDGGADADRLVVQLQAAAGGELPQSLTYLIHDVGRRHGELRLSNAETLIRSEESARLAEVAVDRRLSKLGLRLLAPTVLSSQASLSETMAALRKAGYFPMPEQDLDDAPTTITRTVRPNSPPDARAAASLSAHELASALHGVAARADHRSSTELAVLDGNTLLSEDEVHQLAHAIDTGAPVTIAYESATGARTRRIISDASLAAGSLYAYCHLRNDERFFTLSRVFQVTAAP